MFIVDIVQKGNAHGHAYLFLYEILFLKEGKRATWWQRSLNYPRSGNGILGSLRVGHYFSTVDCLAPGFTQLFYSLKSSKYCEQRPRWGPCSEHQSGCVSG